MGALAGASLFGLRSREALAADPSAYGGQFFLQIQARGAWDVTFLCDGKRGKLNASGAPLFSAVSQRSGYVTQAGNDPLLFQTNPPTGSPLVLDSPGRFFDDFADRLLVVNGLDFETNNHSSGIQASSCGDRIGELPTLAALFAGANETRRQAPVAFLAGGQYNVTGDVVGVSRVFGGVTAAVADPYSLGSASAQYTKDSLSASEVDRIRELRRKRAEALVGGTRIENKERTLSTFVSATRGNQYVVAVKRALDLAGAHSESGALPPAFVKVAPGTFTRTGANAVAKQVTASVTNGLETILQCFKAGVAVSANFEANQFGTFDSHGGHDTLQKTAMGGLLAHLRYLFTRADELGISHRLNVLVISDFGRTPYYVGSGGSERGTEHWNIGSAMLAGPIAAARRSVGATDDRLRAHLVSVKDPTKTLPVDSTTGESVASLAKVSPNAAAALKEFTHPGTGDIYVRPRVSHLHRSMRKALGIIAERPDFDVKFRLPYDKHDLKLV